MAKFSMTKKYILLFLFFYLNPFYGIALSFAQSDSMNYFLEKKKAELDPFQNFQNNSQPKIDLESMGLDNVEVSNDSKNNSKINNYQDKSAIIVNNSQKSFNKIDNNNSIKDKINNNKNSLKPNNNTNLAKQIEYNNQNNPQNAISSTLKKSDSLLTKTAIINNQKKQKLALRLQQESHKMKLSSDKNQLIIRKDEDVKIIQNPDDWQNQLFEKTNSDSINQENIVLDNDLQNEIINFDSKKMSLAEKKNIRKKTKKNS